MEQSDWEYSAGRTLGSCVKMLALPRHGIWVPRKLDSEGAAVKGKLEV